jgi:hypothetical protein
MKYLSSFFIILLWLSITGCKDSGTQVQGTGTQTYPTSLNNEWEYQTIWTFSYYDHSGSIDSTSNENLDNSIIKIIKTNDSLKNYKELVEFEMYDKLSPQEKSHEWYLNSDTCFIAIAYNNAGTTQVIEPKRYSAKRYLTLSEYKEMMSSLFPDIRTLDKTTLGDSIQYYDIPRKVLTYPLSVGNKWVELYIPFYRERYINNYLNIDAGNLQFDCYEIKAKMPDYGMELNDYISLNSGLIKREIIADSLEITTPENPDGIGLFAKVITTSTLIRKNF